MDVLPSKLVSPLLARDNEVRLRRGGAWDSEWSALPSRLSSRRLGRGGTLPKVSNWLKLRSRCLRSLKVLAQDMCELFLFKHDEWRINNHAKYQCMHMSAV